MTDRRSKEYFSGKTQSPESLPLNFFLLSRPNVLVFHQKNSGVCSARNLGIEKATGDYLCFVDGDDYLEQDYFSKANIILEKSHPKLLVNTYKIENKDNDCLALHFKNSKSRDDIWINEVDKYNCYITAYGCWDGRAGGMLFDYRDEYKEEDNE